MMCESTVSDILKSSQICQRILPNPQEVRKRDATGSMKLLMVGVLWGFKAELIELQKDKRIKRQWKRKTNSIQIESICFYFPQLGHGRCQSPNPQ